MTAPAAISWAARTGWLNVAPTSLAFLGYAFTPWILTLLALAELVSDQLPTTPSRKAPGPFGARILSGALSGAAIGVSRSLLFTGMSAGILGAVIGTVGGRVSCAACRGVRKGSAGGPHRGCHCNRRRFPDRGGTAIARSTTPHSVAPHHTRARCWSLSQHRSERTEVFAVRAGRERPRRPWRSQQPFGSPALGRAGRISPMLRPLWRWSRAGLR